MAVKDVRPTLQQVCADLEQAGETAAADRVSRLAGIEEQLRHVADGPTEDPEALAFPDPQALDTIHENLAALAEEADEETAIHLRRARDGLLRAIATLEDELAKQRDTGTA